MATQTREEIIELGFEASFVLFCIKLGKTAEEIMERTGLDEKRLNKNYKKLLKSGYIKACTSYSYNGCVKEVVEVKEIVKEVVDVKEIVEEIVNKIEENKEELFKEID